MSPLERRGWYSAAVDAFHLKGADGGAGAARLLTSLARHGGRIGKVDACKACGSGLPNRGPASELTVRVYASHLRGALSDVGFVDVLKPDGDGGYVVHPRKLRELDAFVRSFA